MSTQQATLSDQFDNDDGSSDYECPLCGEEIAKINLSTHLSSDCDSEHREVNHEY